MIWFKTCPRCDGDLSDDRDVFGPYISCLACGYYLTIAEEAVIWSSPSKLAPIRGVGTSLEETVAA